MPAFERLGVLVGVPVGPVPFWWSSTSEKPTPARMTSRASPTNRIVLPVKKPEGLLLIVSSRLAPVIGTVMDVIGESEESGVRSVV